jgi:hypothetical protein
LIHQETAPCRDRKCLTEDFVFLVTGYSDRRTVRKGYPPSRVGDKNKVADPLENRIQQLLFSRICCRSVLEIGMRFFSWRQRGLVFMFILDR